MEESQESPKENKIEHQIKARYQCKFCKKAYRYRKGLYTHLMLCSRALYPIANTGVLPPALTRKLPTSSNPCRCFCIQMNLEELVETQKQILELLERMCEHFLGGSEEAREEDYESEINEMKRLLVVLKENSVELYVACCLVFISGIKPLLLKSITLEDLVNYSKKEQLRSSFIKISPYASRVLKIPEAAIQCFKGMAASQGPILTKSLDEHDSDLEAICKRFKLPKTTLAQVRRMHKLSYDVLNVEEFCDEILGCSEAESSKVIKDSCLKKLMLSETSDDSHTPSADQCTEKLLFELCDFIQELLDTR
eukprot:TRINITY_DN4168_c0_g7_i1.p1 TRINITY_DN4168_c0_g7~~TRINITY_DN4168_c0_g7_i1.p1  ORF type:complete len:309 (+),score=98.66 TRINITY_DN4168_c0_g7_i1:152-1078(+)